MEATLYIEIPVKVTFSANPGYPQTHDEPGCRPEVEDIDYDEQSVISAVNEAIYGKKSTIDEDLLEHAENEGRRYEEDKADYKYHEMKERGEI